MFNNKQLSFVLHPSILFNLKTNMIKANMNFATTLSAKTPSVMPVTHSQTSDLMPPRFRSSTLTLMCGIVMGSMAVLPATSYADSSYAGNTDVPSDATVNSAVNSAADVASNVNNVSSANPQTTLDPIIVTASPWQAQAGEMATATSIVTSDQLLSQPASTLGDVLSNEPGVSADSFGQGASRPIIRGQTAPRVKVMQNGLTVHDASQISPDHQVSVPVIGAKQIEVIKGTSALMYGGGATGGVVNVVNNTLPHPNTMPAPHSMAEGMMGGIVSNVSGELAIIGQQATDGYLGYASLAAELTDNWLLQAQVQKTDQANLQVPHWDSDKINNSWHTQDNASIGATYVGELGLVGASYQRQTSEYGLPFHVHNQCSPSSQNPNHLDCGSHHHHHEHGKPPYVDLQSDVYQLVAERAIPMIGVDKLTAKASYTDYHHDEIDEGVAGTTFSNRAISGRMDATLATIEAPKFGFVKGMVGIDANRSDFSAVGLEGYLPKTDSTQVGLYVIQRLTPDYLAADNIGSSATSDKFASQPSQHTHSHSGHNHSEDNQATTSKPMLAPIGKSPWYLEFGVRQDFLHIEDSDNNTSKGYAGTSASVEGGRYLSPNSQLSVRLSHSQRLPASQELFANGAHLATNTWERGNPQLDIEKTNGIELTYRFDNAPTRTAAGNQGVFNTQISGFYNDTSNYIYAQTRDMIRQGESAGFALVDYAQSDAQHYGGEISSRYYLTDHISVGGFADIALIKLKNQSADSSHHNSRYAPHLAAPRVGGDITAQIGQFDAVLSGYHRFEQDKIADFETITPSYNMLDAKLVYHSAGKQDYTAFIQIKNILNELAYNHASYLVEHVPLTQRSVNAGVTFKF